MESFIVRFNILDDIACITNTIEKDTEYTPVVSIVIELFNGFRVVPHRYQAKEVGHPQKEKIC